MRPPDEAGDAPPYVAAEGYRGLTPAARCRDGRVLHEADPQKTAVVLVGHGGVHAEVEIPETLARLRATYPHVELRYIRPIDLTLVAQMVVDQLGRVHPLPR